MKKTSSGAARLGLVGAEDHALAGGEAVGLQHRRVGDRGRALRRPPRGCAAARGTRSAPRPRAISSLAKAFEPSSSAAAGARAEGRRSRPPRARRRRRRPAPPRVRSRRGRRPRSVASGDDRLDVFGGDRREALRVGRDPGVAWRAEQLRRGRRAAPAPARSRARGRRRRRRAPSSAGVRPRRAAPLERAREVRGGIAVSVWLVIVPREPSSTEIFAIVLLVGRLDHRDEVVLAERRVLGDHLGRPSARPPCSPRPPGPDCSSGSVRPRRSGWSASHRSACPLLSKGPDDTPVGPIAIGSAGSSTRSGAGRRSRPGRAVRRASAGRSRGRRRPCPSAARRSPRRCGSRWRRS